MSKQLLPFTAGLLLGVVVSMSMIIFFYHTQDVTLAEQMHKLSQELKAAKMTGAIGSSGGTTSVYVNQQATPPVSTNPQHLRTDNTESAKLTSSSLSQAILSGNIGGSSRATPSRMGNNSHSFQPSKRKYSAVPDYHKQAEYADEYGVPFIPTLDYAKSLRDRPLPDMSKQHAVNEPENLKLHLCNNRSEAYGAAYLTTVEFIKRAGFEKWDLSGVICEAPSFKIMRFGTIVLDHPRMPGIVMQSLDVLDYAVIHLSAFERAQFTHRKLLYELKDWDTAWHNIDPVIAAGKRLASINDPTLRGSRRIKYLPEAMRTIAVMPFLGGEMGEGHSVVGNRFEYLKTCFWSLYEFFPFIAAGVTRQEDVDWAKKESGLPFYDIMKLSDVPEAAGLPSATVLETKRRIEAGTWDFDYIFFTESDQILIVRELPMLYADLKKYPGHMLVPHRLYPYSKKAIEIVHKKNPRDTQLQENDWMKRSCCLPRQNCMGDTVWTMWTPFADSSVAAANYYGLYVPLGNGNFLHEVSRPCTLMDYVGESGFCP